MLFCLSGEMVLRIVENDAHDCYPHNQESQNKPPEPTLTFRDIAIKAGEIFLLPPKVLHSPQRFEHSVGLVVEQKRTRAQQDALFWFCSQCKNSLYREQFHLANIEQDLPPVFERYWSSKNTECKKCGHKHEKN